MINKIRLTALCMLLIIFGSMFSPTQEFVSPVFASTSGGPIVLDGMDPVCHASYGERTDIYISKVVKSVYDQSTMPSNTGKIAILGISSPTSAAGCGGNWSTLLSTKFLTQFTTAPTVEFITSAAQLNAFFAGGISAAPPRMIWIPDDWSRAGTIDAIFTTNAEKIADYVNSGGGLFTSNNGYGWLTSLLPSAAFNNGGCNGGPEATADGTADFGLTNTMVAACWHGYFTGSFGTLKTLVDYPYPSPTSTRKSVSIGGGSVSLPSSFTIGVSPANPAAGENITITAIAQTLAGVPQSGVTVTITVSSGPDAGSTFTATTDSTGTATIVVRTNSVGSAVYTATATVNGVAKTVSATVTWIPPTTTTAAPTTTTTEPPTTTTILPTTTTSTTSTTVAAVVTTSSTIPVVQEVPAMTIANPTTTTIHDHSTHSHGPLPQTGTKSFNILMIALYLIIAGLIFICISPKTLMRIYQWKR